jgi:hypothetical protein
LRRCLSAERRHFAGLMLCTLGVAAAVSGYTELGMMHSATSAEYGEWQRRNHVPVFLAFIAQLLFIHYYLGTGRLWLMWAIIFARSAVLLVNFSVHPSFNFSNIVSLDRVSLLGEQIPVSQASKKFAVVSVIDAMARIPSNIGSNSGVGYTRSKRVA